MAAKIRLLFAINTSFTIFTNWCYNRFYEASHSDFAR